MMRKRLLLPILVLVSSVIGMAQRAPSAASSRAPMVVVISLDALGAESLRDLYLPAPTLHALMKSGSYADSMKPINPTVTWPNHTSMITGVDAAQHHVIVNGLMTDQRSEGKPHVVADAPKSTLVAVPTVYDAAHAAGLTTAEVDWVAIHKASSITWSFAENPDPASTVVQEMLREGIVTQDELDHFHKASQAFRDRIYTRAAVHILRRHHPNLALFHLLALDGIEHKTGFGNDAGRNTIAFLDDRVREIVDAVREAGDMDRTTFLIVSDHGQMSVHHLLHPNALLEAAPADIAQRTHVVPDGGFALVYQRDATPASITKLRELFAEQTGVRAALIPTEAAAEGWPTPDQTTQAPDLLLYAADEYAFAAGDTGSFVTDTLEVGQHGYPNSEPLMQAIFIASGRGIRKGREIPAFPNVRIAPTIAKLLGIPFASPPPALAEILQ